MGCPSSWLCGKGPVTGLRRSGNLYSHKLFTLDMIPETFQLIRSLVSALTGVDTLGVS